MKEITINLKTFIIILLIMLLIIMGLLFYIINERVNIIKETNEIDVSVYDSDKEVQYEQDTQNTYMENEKAQNIDGNKTINKNHYNKEEKIEQFNNKFYELKEVSKEYRFSEKIKKYKDFSYDIDGNGVIDKITIERNKENDGESYIFKLDGVEFAEHYNQPEIYITDLNENDETMEIVIYDDGPSDDPNYTIYVKNENKIVELKKISGYPLKTDKKGTILVDDFYNANTIPRIYFSYYLIKNNKLQEKYINIEDIENVKLSAQDLYFSEDYSNIDKFYQEGNLDEIEKSLKKANIEKLDEKDIFTILSFNVNDNEDGMKEYKIQVKLSDGRKGYIFNLQLAG